MKTYRYGWKNNTKRAEFFGRTCQFVASGKKKGSVLVELESGQREIISCRALRKLKDNPIKYCGGGKANGDKKRPDGEKIDRA